jgi:thioester reductase-like protein
MAFDETVFLTGFPGFIASRLVQRLASEGARLLLLVQPAFEERARNELVRIASDTGRLVSDFRIVAGDITQDNLGLSPRELEMARAETRTIFHLAAIYDLVVARDVGVRVNVDGTRNLNNFARTLPHLRGYQYVSTCYVAGKRKGRIHETELRHDAGFRNHYEETKYLAELEVEALKSDLPVTIHRPAVVVGDSTTGETAKYDGVYYLIHYLLRMPRSVSLVNIGNRKVSLNLVPVDFVIEAMTALARDDRAIGKTLQLADPQPLTTRELCDVIAKTIYGRGSPIALPAWLVEFSLSLPLSPKITGLPHSGVPYFFLKQTYDTVQAQELLEPHRIHCPPFSTYVKAIVDFAARHPTL